VAATRAMNHLVQVGQHRNPGHQGLIEGCSCSINDFPNWMGWISKILNLSENLNGKRHEAAPLPDPFFCALRLCYK
jgi:hypothetical protein